MFEDVFLCGPLEVTLKTESPDLRWRFGNPLGQYDVRWSKPYIRVELNVAESTEPRRMVQGNYLHCARMNVDWSQGGVVATCLSGFSGLYSAERDRWDITVVHSLKIPEDYVRCDIDDLAGLVLTVGWRRAGWIPIHSGAVTFSKACAIICAPSGGGKTTLTTALIRRGWLTLGDDRLLLRLGKGGQPELGALLHSFNLDPKARKWFPEVNNLEAMPTHTSFSDKRRIPIDQFWPKRTLMTGKPTHLLQLLIREEQRGLYVDQLSNGELLPILLSQTVIPTHPQTANQILSTMATVTRMLHGFRVEIGYDAYDSDSPLSKLEEALTEATFG